MAYRHHLAKRFAYPPICYQRGYDLDERCERTVRDYGDRIPPSVLMIMFGKQQWGMNQLFRKFWPKPQRSARQIAFRRFLDAQYEVIESFRLLLPEERVYLYKLRDALRCFYSGTIRSAENILKNKEAELARAAKAFASKRPRVRFAKCSNPRCPRKYPPEKPFFPTMREKSKTPGRCYICFSKRRTNSRRAASQSRERIKRPIGKPLSAESLELLGLCDSLGIPMVGIVALLAVSSSQIEEKRTAEISREEALARYYRWLGSPKAPRYRELSEEQNALLANCWQAQREKLSGCKDASSYEERRQELLRYTEQKRQDSTAFFKRCATCQNIFVKDDQCFHVLRIRNRKPAFVASCIPCVNEKRSQKHRHRGGSKDS